jgi:hypothetical protein
LSVKCGVEKALSVLISSDFWEITGSAESHIVTVPPTKIVSLLRERFGWKVDVDMFGI